MRDADKHSCYIPRGQLYGYLAHLLWKNNEETLKEIITNVAKEFGYAENEYHYNDIADRVIYAMAVDLISNHVLEVEGLANRCTEITKLIMGDIVCKDETYALGKMYIDGFPAE